MNLTDLAQRLINGDINLATWQTEMRGMIRVIHREATATALGGMGNVTQSMWGFEGSLVKKQYQFLDGFAADIAQNPDQWLNGRLEQRMRLYAQAEWGTFEKVLQRQARLDGLTEEARILGMADHCPDCIAWSVDNLGWQPIGGTPDIGASVCATNCRCTKEYR